MVCIHRNGSVLLIVIIMTGLMSLLSIGWWKQASMKYDIALARERLYQNFYVTDLVLAYGLELAKRNFSFFLQQAPWENRFDMSFIVKKLPFHDTMQKSAVLFIARRDKDLWIRARLMSYGKPVFTLQCLLVQRVRYYIEQYTICTEL